MQVQKDKEKVVVVCLNALEHFLCCRLCEILKSLTTCDTFNPCVFLLRFCLPSGIMCNLTCTKYIISQGLIVTGGHDNLILVWTLDTLGKFY